MLSSSSVAVFDVATNLIPQYGHVPGFFVTKSECIEQVNRFRKTGFDSLCGSRFGPELNVRTGKYPSSDPSDSASDA